MDKAYDFRKCRAACRRRAIKHRIARRGIESKEKLGRHRWVIERTFAWLACYRRLTIRYERLPAMHHAFPGPGPMDRTIDRLHQRGPQLMRDSTDNPKECTRADETLDGGR